MIELNDFPLNVASQIKVILYVSFSTNQSSHAIERLYISS